MGVSGYGTLKGGGVGGYRMANGGTVDSSPSSSRLKGHFSSFPSGAPSSLGMLSRISEVDNESSITTVPDDEKHRDGNSEAQFYNMRFPFTSWSDSPQLDNEGKLCANADQIEEVGNKPPILSHHLSLPKTPTEIAAIEKLLHFQDTIPCKIRAKRGCATHPRSIAERVRRTRISERMRKLQELVPNMDKQTNTADMLDLAVEYIKDLQRQYKQCRSHCKTKGSELLMHNGEEYKRRIHNWSFFSKGYRFGSLEKEKEITHKRTVRCIKLQLCVRSEEEPGHKNLWLSFLQMVDAIN